MIKSRNGNEWILDVLDVACGSCGIAQHPTGTVKECPVGGCHVCCKGGDARGCNYEDGRIFFRALFKKLVKNPANPFEVVTAWQGWRDQLGI